MSKVRVYEVARELGLENRELLGRIQSLGIQVRNHMSALEPAEVERVRRALDKDKAENTVETRIRKTVIRRRTKKAEAGAADDTAVAVEESQPAEVRPIAKTKPRMAPRDRAAVADGAGSDRTSADAPMSSGSEASAVSFAAGAPGGSAAASSAVGAPSVVASTKRSPVTSAPAGGSSAVALAAASEAAGSSAALSAAGGSSAALSAAGGSSAALSAESSAAASSSAGSSAALRSIAGSGEVGSPSAGSPASERSATVITEVEPDAPQGQRGSPSQPPPAAQRLGHANLPPGVLSRGNQTAPSAGTISESTRARIVQQHAQQRGPRRREVGRRELGQPGRPTGGRTGRRRISPNKRGLKTEITVPGAQKRIIRIEDNVNLQVLANRMSMKATDVLMKLMQMGEMGVTINSTLDTDTAKLIAGEFGYEVENVAKSEHELISEMRGEFDDLEEAREHRAPVITVMGHVDHGKTSLLDKIRNATVAAGEAGGITQHIGAYRVETDRGPIAFIDTPGHEAFTEMRARGAQATDIVILVVAADDGVMPQTKEAINHAKAAGVPIIVAVNKIDRPDANPQAIRNELVGYGLQPEEWGGHTLFADVSALTGQGIDELLENITLQAEMLELTANSSIPGEGVVLEAKLDRGRGPVANVLIRNGTLRQGDTVVAGAAMGKVRALTDERGNRVKEAGPSTPVEVLGLSEVPQAGEGVYVVDNEERARELVEQRQKDASARAKRKMKTGLEAWQDTLKKGDSETLNIIIKGDVQGSVEALHKALVELSTDKVDVNVIHTGVGGITEQDVMLSSTSSGIIIGFNVRPVGKAGATAKAEGVDIRGYKVIYEAVDDVKKAMVGLLAPEQREKEMGKAEVRETFGIPKLGTIAGSYVTDGKIVRNGKCRLVREGVVVWEGDISSLRRFKDDVKEVALGFECGIGLVNYSDIKQADIIECFIMEEVQATL